MKGLTNCSIKQHLTTQGTPLKYTIEQLQKALSSIMTQHDGADKAITKADLFKLVFGNPRGYTLLQLYQISQDMNRCFNRMRKDDLCTIVSALFPAEEGDKIRMYYLATNPEELKPYVTILEKNIKGSKRMIKVMSAKVNNNTYRQFIQDNAETSPALLQ